MSNIWKSSLTFHNPYSLTARSSYHGWSRKENRRPDADEVAQREFEAGLARSIDQYKAGLVKAFKTKEEFLDHLKNLENDA